MAATGILKENQGFHIILLAIIVASWLMLNEVFFKDLICVLRSSPDTPGLTKEYFWLLAAGCTNIYSFAIIYYIFGINGPEGVVVGDLQASIYFSIVTWTTLGYGDYSPVENIRFVAAFEALMGYFYMAILVGLLLNYAQTKTRITQ